MVGDIFLYTVPYPGRIHILSPPNMASMSPFYDDFRDEGKNCKYCSATIINDIVISNHGGGVSDALLLKNNHMDPNNSENLDPEPPPLPR